MGKSNHFSGQQYLEIPNQASSIEDKVIFNSISGIKAYSSKGYFMGTVKSEEELKQYEKGLLILKIYDKDGFVKTIKYINK